MKRGLRWLTSMSFAVAILVVIGLLSVAGTVIPQGGAKEEYLHLYGDMGQWIPRLGLDRVYTAWWFILATVLLCLSLLTCVVLRFTPLKMALRGGWKKGARKLGSWLLHLGILLTIVFFGLGNATAYQNQIYNVPGKTSTIPNTPYEVAVDAFDVILRPDDTVERYESKLRVIKEGKLVAQDSVLVNAPLTVDGYQISQASFGLAVDVQIKKGGQALGEAVLFDGEVVTAEEDRIVIQLIRMFPDVSKKEDGFYNASQKLKNPYLDYRLYYGGNLVSSGLIPVTDTLSAGPYELSFAKARHFTVLDVRKDVFAKFVAASALLLTLGIFLSLFGPEAKQREESKQ